LYRRPSQLGEEQFLHAAEGAHLMTAVPTDDLAVVTLGLIKTETIPATDGAAQLNSHSYLSNRNDAVGLCKRRLKLRVSTMQRRLLNDLLAARDSLRATSPPGHGRK
jgi:hypothetical protein